MSAETGPAPPPPTPEYLAESMSGDIKAILWTFTAIATISVILRCYTRLFLRRVFGVDDYIMLLAMATLIAYAAVIEVAATKGLGRHIEFVMQDLPNAVNVALLCQISQPLVIMSCAFGKTSFGLTLMRVAAQKWIHYVLWFIIITMNICHILVSIMLFVRCEDPRTLWNPAIVSKCWPPYVFLNFSLFIGAYSAASDFALALMPWAMLWNLQMKNREKIGVAVAMSLGIVAGAVAIVKATKLPSNTTDVDVTWAMGPLLWWAGVENALIIIGACVPTLRPFLKKVFPGSSAKKSGDSNSHALKPLSSRNMFTPKSKQGQWSAIVESELQNDQKSDDQSDKSILHQHANKETTIESGIAGPRQPERTSTRGQPHITKTMSVDVSYGNRSTTDF